MPLVSFAPFGRELNPRTYFKLIIPKEEPTKARINFVHFKGNKREADTSTHVVFVDVDLQGAPVFLLVPDPECQPWAGLHGRKQGGWMGGSPTPGNKGWGTGLGRPLLLHIYLLPVQTWPPVLNAVDVRSTADGLNEVWGDQPRGTV